MSNSTLRDIRHTVPASSAPAAAHTWVAAPAAGSAPQSPARPTAPVAADAPGIAPVMTNGEWCLVYNVLPLSEDEVLADAPKHLQRLMDSIFESGHERNDECSPCAPAVRPRAYNEERSAKAEAECALAHEMVTRWIHRAQLYGARSHLLAKFFPGSKPHEASQATLRGRAKSHTNTGSQWLSQIWRARRSMTESVTRKHGLDSADDEKQRLLTHATQMNVQMQARMDAMQAQMDAAARMAEEARAAAPQAGPAAGPAAGQSGSPHAPAETAAPPRASHHPSSLTPEQRFENELAASGGVAAENEDAERARREGPTAAPSATQASGRKERKGK
jgi:hypothetical protein